MRPDAAVSGAGDGPVSRAVPLAPLVAIGAAGFTAFLGMYATQPILPTLGRAFAASKGAVAMTVSASTIAIALGSPVAGAVADRVGHRRLISLALGLLVVPTALAATSTTLRALVAWRFLQGLVVPGVYVAAIALVTAEWQGGGVGQVLAAFVTGNVVGGFTGRVVSGAVAEWLGWRASFAALAVLTAAGAVAAWRLLPRPTRAPPAPRGGGETLRQAGAALRDARLLATFAVGFNVLFAQVATFTYVTFHLADPPFRLGAAALGGIFVVYLVGAVVTPVAGRWIDRFGSRAALAAALATAMAGGAFTLAPRLWAVVLGLALGSTAVFVSQAASTAYLQVAAPPRAHSIASGLYVSSYYLGGSAGAAVPALAWRVGGWPACVGLVLLVQAVTIALALRFWVGRAALDATEPA